MDDGSQVVVTSQQKVFAHNSQRNEPQARQHDEAGPSINDCLESRMAALRSSEKKMTEDCLV